MTIIENIHIYDYETFIEHGYMLFDETIHSVGTMEELNIEREKRRAEGYNEANKEDRDRIDTVIDGKGRYLLPGLVLGHSHIYSSFARGWVTPFHPQSFEDILKQMWWKLDRALDLDMIYASGRMAAYNFVQQGVTTVIDHHASGTIKGSLNALAKAIVDEGHMRGIFCFEASDRFDIDACIEENLAFSEEHAYKDNVCSTLFGMHASFTLSDDSLRAIAKRKGQLPIHIHIAESKEDVVWTQEHSGMNIMERLDRFNLISEGNLYAHGLFLSKEELRMIKTSQGTLVINPISNMNNGVGLVPTRLLQEMQIPWIIGNDGLGFGLIPDLKQCYYIDQLAGFEGMGLEGVRQSIKRNYAYASQRLGISLGTFCEGAAADFILMDYEPMTPIHEGNVMGHVFFGMMDGWQPEEVIIRGKRVYSRTQNGDKDEDMAYGMIQEQARRLWAAADKGGQMYATE